MKKRLISFLKHLGIGQLAFEENVGLSRGYVNKVGDNITVKSLNKISSLYPELNINWLKTGEGEMLKNNSKTNSIHNIGDGNQSSIGGQIQNKSYKVEKNQESVLSEGQAKYSVAQIIEPDAEKTVPYFLYKELQEENKELIKKIMRLEMMLEKNNIID